MAGLSRETASVEAEAASFRDPHSRVFYADGRVLRALSAQGRDVEDVEVRGPSLQSVFIHLTGRELRE